MLLKNNEWGRVDECHTKLFGDCAELIREIVLPSSLPITPYIGLEHIGESSLSLSGYGASSDVESLKSKFSRGDILFGKLRPYFRKIVRAPFDGICSTDIWVVRASKEIEQGYLYYCMASQPFVDFVDSGSEGTRMPRAKWEFASQFELSIPPLPKQRAIAHFLGTLDDKIELNRRINETLEAMARALFKSWFVDFDPVRAKMEGRDTGLPKHIADLFPDRLVDSELGEIPEGWEVGTVRQLAERIQNGGTPKRSEPTYWEHGEIPWLTSGEIRQSLILGTQNFISEEGLAKSSAKIVPARSILVALYGATAGQVSMNYQPLSTNQAISAIIPSTGNKYFCLMSLKLEVSELENRAVGSAQQNISKKIVEDTMILLPCLKLRSTYDALVKPLFDRNFHNLDENQTLSTLRDTLLPKLMSGELRVKNTKKFIGKTKS